MKKLERIPKTKTEVRSDLLDLQQGIGKLVDELAKYGLNRTEQEIWQLLDVLEQTEDVLNRSGKSLERIVGAALRDLKTIRKGKPPIKENNSVLPVPPIVVEGISRPIGDLLQGVRQKGILLIASTNRPYEIDLRLLEPGRLSKVIHVPLPDAEERRGILDLHLENAPFASNEAKNKIIGQMAQETDGWTGRYLKELSLEAGRLCLLEALGNDISKNVSGALPAKPLELFHFQHAKEIILSSVNMREFQRQDKQIQEFIARTGGNLGFSP